MSTALLEKEYYYDCKKDTYFFTFGQPFQRWVPLAGLENIAQHLDIPAQKQILTAVKPKLELPDRIIVVADLTKFPDVRVKIVSTKDPLVKEIDDQTFQNLFNEFPANQVCVVYINSNIESQFVTMDEFPS